jgi:hypothetical protein
MAYDFQVETYRERIKEEGWSGSTPFTVAV